MENSASFFFPLFLLSFAVCMQVVYFSHDLTWILWLRESETASSWDGRVRVPFIFFFFSFFFEDYIARMGLLYSKRQCIYIGYMISPVN